MRRFFLPILVLSFTLGACAVESKHASIEGKVILSPALASKIGPSDILYVLAYPVTGLKGSEKQSSFQGAPLAVRKIAPVIFPVKYEMSEADVMFPEKKFEGLLNVMARLHKNPESAPAQKGDFEGLAKRNPAAVGSKNIDIILEPSL